MANWTIRKAEDRDAIGLSNCIEAAYAPYSARIDDLPPVSADCAAEIAKYQVWVAEFDGKIVGALVLSPEERAMRLANVAVHPDHQGTGLGGTLMALADSESQRQSFCELRLNTHAAMTDNIALYRHLGWEECGRSGNKVSMKKGL